MSPGGGDGAHLWILHAPAYLDAIARAISPPPGLILCGHTHGGQVRVPLLPAPTPGASGRFVAGWYRDALAPIYVSRGIGTSIVPARFRCRPELPIFTLRAPA
jgi:predicted MPP superfamily phosphohydrolase